LNAFAEKTTYKENQIELPSRTRIEKRNRMSSIHFNDHDVLCVDNSPLTEFIRDYIADPNESGHIEDEIIMNEKNELEPKHTRLSTPLYIYSKHKLLENFLNYKNSFHKVITDELGIETNISYSLKANFNPSILKLFQQNGSWCSLVNKNELDLALRCGFTGNRLIFNGNGKTMAEIEMAVKASCYLNIDSLFNLVHTIKVCKRLANKSTDDKQVLPAKIIVRINQSISAKVHQYLDTSVKTCKFGINESALDDIIELIKENSEYVKLVGLHTHLGSTIKSVDIYDRAVENLLSIVDTVRQKVDTIELINFGGGLGIEYERYAQRTSKDRLPETTMPTAEDLAKTIARHLQYTKHLKVVVEPGRSLVGNAALLLTNLIGVKRNEHRNFLVVDASMCECLRPCLYSAYHHIDYVQPLSESIEKRREFVDIVGPVCESGDFLGKERYMSMPVSTEHETSSIYLAVMDVGAYCSAMSLNYNLHPKPAEILYDNETNKYVLMRKPDSLADILRSYTDFN
jgi:diaminopimelate decarboxylase